MLCFVKQNGALVEFKTACWKTEKATASDLEYFITYMQGKGKKKGEKSDLTRRNFLPPMNSECLI